MFQAFNHFPMLDGFDQSKGAEKKSISSEKAFLLNSIDLTLLSDKTLDVESNLWNLHMNLRGNTYAALVAKNAEFEQDFIRIHIGYDLGDLAYIMRLNSLPRICERLEKYGWMPLCLRRIRDDPGPVAYT